MRLGKRLRCVVNEINCDYLADIGCDHGKVAVTAILENRASKAVCTDISAPSLDKAKELAKSKKIDDKIAFTVGDGLTPIKGENIDQAVIAGMGAREIIKILSAHKCKASSLILVAHKGCDLLREFLHNNGYRIVKDYICLEGRHFYSIILAEVGCGSLAPKEKYYGKNDIKNADYIKYLEYEKAKLEKLLDRVDESVINEIKLKLEIIGDEL